MGDLTKNFSRHEFRCKCGQCDCDTIDSETLNILQETVALFELRLNTTLTCTINSAHRCQPYNEEVGGSPNSQHLQGRAVDFVINGVDPADVYDYLTTAFPNQYGIGKYETFTHLDTRTTPARW